jgi:hypothetical protein
MVKIGATSIHPLGFFFGILNLVVGLISLTGCACGLWVILSDWSHITFTRCVVLFFCVWLGALSAAMTVHRVRVWKRVLASRV